MAGRTWVAVALSLLIWFVYLKFFAPPPVAPTAKTPAVNESTSSPSTAPSTPGNAAPASPGTLFSAAPAGLSAPLTSGNLQIAFQDNGGKIGQVAVTTYRETIDKTSPPITPISPDKSATSLATVFSDPALAPFANAPYQRRDQGELVRFERADAGLSVTKEYRVGTGPYSLETVVRVQVAPGAKRDWGFLYIPIGATSLAHDTNDPLKAWEVVSYIDEKLIREPLEGLDDGERVLQGQVHWLAFGNRYFSNVLLNQPGINPDVVFAKNKDFSGAYLRYPLQFKQGQDTVELRYVLYVGPKDYDELVKFPGLKQLIDYGMFSWLAYLMLEVLRFFYGLIHNYGVAIILLTVLVRALLYPLSLKSYKSMKAMQKLQPQLTALREKYKEDPARFNQEQLALFKAHKVNPMGGCLPMLVQLPVFIALYSLLGNSVELFHEPFFGWIRDLSAKDPYYVYPVLMGLSMLLQQRLTPTPGMDPIQVKMMYLMPIVFTVIMLNLPAGLTIYIFLSTLLGIIQQLLMNREPGSASTKLATATHSAGK